MGPKVQVPGTTDVFSEDIVSPLQSDLVPSDEHPCSPEVFSEPVHTVDNKPVDLALVSMPNRYELPLGSTRGVPPKRYDPEFEAQRSSYPISRESNEALSQSALAFNTSLYSNDAPKNVEEAFRDPK